MLCLASSMSFLISGVMVKCSFWGMGKGTMGDRTISGFLLLPQEEMIHETEQNKCIDCTVCDLAVVSFWELSVLFLIFQRKNNSK